ncbi:MAG: hypothetical protein ACD_42C00498G0005 [uncultured bacterium]|nr:MAG: hypothetical protein ACD_42C00498G0005 [uncultured bacterium]OGT33479.1 MAG: hypothetical protein A3C44_02980 [Gammaproteobacteria bacterium RIFCSPHIGHO2_02_FULL_39_13]OGT49697.1 MAG: hypothetical protein A3E53_06545 [Gammaproteobacteria bacterium RIFCSPHIGHO2_12_FULL_39_24]
MRFQYIESNLLNNEKLLYGVRPHWIIFVSGCALVALGLYAWIFSPFGFSTDIFASLSAHSVIAVALLLVGLYWILSAYIYFVTSEYCVTNKRVVIKVGWIKRSSLELLLDKVEGVLVDQSIPGRIFNYGIITIIGTGGTKDSFPYIPNPLLFRKNVEEAVEEFEKRV